MQQSIFWPVLPLRLGAVYLSLFILSGPWNSADGQEPPAAPPAPPAVPTAPLAGRVFRKGDRVPLAGVQVLLDTGEPEALTDANGRFSFDALPVGEHKIKLRGGDVSAADSMVTLNAGKRLEVSLYVSAKERYVTTVRGKKVIVETVEQTLQQEEIKKIPGTQGDVLKAVQNLPGVARAPFGLGLLVVWGSLPQDTRTYVDGVYIPTLYHFGGLRSTINSEMVDSLTFVPGAYGADHGMGLGGIAEVATRRPRTDGYHGFVQVDLMDGSLMVEGPIGDKASFAVAARRSWIDAFLPLLIKNKNFQLSPAYWDYQARLSYHPSRRDDLDLFIFGSDDTVTVGLDNQNPDLNREFGSHIYYHRGMARWLHRFGRGATLSMVASVGFDVPFQVQNQSPTQASSTDAQIFSYTLRAVARVPIASFLRLDGGLDFEGNYFTLDQSSTSAGGGLGGAGPFGALGFGMGGSSGPSDFTLITDHLAPWVSANFSFFDNRLTITPQFRLQLFTFLGYPGRSSAFSSVFAEPDPRLQVRFQVLPWFALKGAVGLFHQAPQPQKFSLLNGNPNLEPEWGIHYVLGAEFKPFSKLHINVEGFYKDLRNLVVPGEYATDPLYTNDGIGRVYGAELLVRLDLWKNLFGWISYTLSRSERMDHPNQDWRIFELDQTHILTILASYKLPRGIQVGVRFRYVTGNPYTPVLSASFDANSDRYIPILGPPYSSRLNSFNQLDIRVDKTFTFNRWRLSFYADIQNVYYAKNPEGVTYNFNYTKQQTINGLPILPVYGIRGDF